MCLVLAMMPVGAQELPPREIFVPRADLPSVLLKSEFAFLERAEYEQLLRDAKIAGEKRPPVEHALLQAEYRGRLETGRAIIDGTIELEVLADGLQRIPLTLSDVGIVSAMLGDRPASIAIDPQLGPVVLVTEKGRHKLAITMTTPLATSAAHQTLQVRLPYAAASTLQLDVPGNVEVKSGAALVARSVDDAKNVTTLQLDVPNGPLAIVLSLNNKQLSKDRVVVVRSVLIDELTQSYERLHGQMAFAVLQGALDNMEVRVPEGFEVTAVDSPLVSRWGVEEGILKIALHEPATETVVVQVTASRMGTPRENWEFPQLSPREVASHAAVVGLLLEDRMQAQTLSPTALSPIDATVLLGAAPAAVLAAGPGLPAIRPIAAWYAPHDLGRLKATFVVPPSSLHVVTGLVLGVSESELSAQLGLSLLPKVEKRFALDVTIPQGWQVVSAVAADNRPLAIERYPHADGTGKLAITFPQGLLPDQTVGLTITAKQVPKGWLDKWVDNRFELPRFTVADAEIADGAISIAAKEDLEIRPERIDGLLPLTDAERRKFDLGSGAGMLAYRHMGSAPDAAFAVVRKTPSMIAAAYNFVALEPGLLRGRYEISYEAREASVRKLSFSLPHVVPNEIVIRGLDGVEVKETTRSILNNRHIWEATLHQRRQGILRLAVEFEMRLDEHDLKDYSVPLIRAEKVDYQTGYVAVEGHPELEVEIPQHPRKVDEGELYASDFHIGSRLVGAYGYAGDVDVKVDVVRQKAHVLPAALARQVAFRTQIAQTGTCQTESVYALRSKAAFVEIELPTGAELWTITIDGKASKPQKTAKRLIVGLPPTAALVERELKIVYESLNGATLLVGDLHVDAPRLLTRETPESEAFEIPVASANWELVLPNDYQVRRSFGTLEANDPRRYVPAFWKMIAWLERFQAPIPLPRMKSNVDLKGGAESTYSYSPPPMAAAPQSEMMHEMNLEQDREARDQRPGDDASQFAAPGKIPQAAAEPNQPKSDMPKREAPAPALQPPGMPPAGMMPNANLPPTTPGASTATWAANLRGVAGLLIGVETAPHSPRSDFFSLGQDPRIRTTLVRPSRLKALGLFTGLAVAAIAVWLARSSLRNAMVWIVFVLVAATLLPSIFIGLETCGEIPDGAFYGAVIAGIALLTCAGLKEVWNSGNRLRTNVLPYVAWFLGRTALVLLVAGLSIAGIAPSAVADPPMTIVVPTELVPTAVPENVVVVPFDADDVEGISKAKTVWVPYAKYQEWLKAAESRRNPDSPEPALPYGLATAEYTGELKNEDRLDVRGKIEIEVLASEPISIPFAFAGGVMVEAKLDDAAAKLQIVNPPAKGKKQAAGPPIMLLTAVPKGRHVFQFTYRMGATRQGGWRVAQGTLPAPSGGKLSLAAAKEATEVRLKGVADRELFETTAAAPTVETALVPPGNVSISWRAKVDQTVAERNVTVKSAAVFDVRQDVLRLSWHTTVEFPQSRRDQLSFTFPKDYVVERIVGENVRTWQTKDADEANTDVKTLDVRLLKEAVDRESITIYLARYGTVGRDAMSTFMVPSILATGASLQQGTLAVRRDTLLELRLLENRGVRREDAQLSPELAAKADSFDISPLPLREYQTYSYSALPITVRFGAAGTLDQSEVVSHALVSISERFAGFESRSTFTPKGRPVHRVDVLLPENLTHVEVESNADGGFEKSLTAEEGKQRLTVFLKKGHASPFSLVVTGRLPSPDKLELAVPRLVFENVARQEGAMAVESDPSYDVRIEPEKGSETIPTGATHNWVQGKRRQAVRAAIQWRDAQYSGRIRLSVRQPVISSRILHNVRVTPRVLEQTVVADFQISNAGVKQVSFLLPKELEAGRINAPNIRQITRSPSTDEATSSYVRVTIDLEDEFLGDYRVQILHDALLAEGPQTIRLPILETGSVRRRFLILESAGRDEVVVDQAQSLEPLTREQAAFSELVQVLGPKITQAYSAVGDKEARLAIALNERETVETAGARIGLAETLFVLDRSGAYRARQSYRVDNSSEQYLEVSLPADATLWTATVDGLPTKPVVAKTPGGNRIRIPILRRAAGDADYEVALVYAGAIDPMGWSGKIKLPFPETVNINVERSVVRLKLPEGFNWFGFGGTMGGPVDEGQVQEQTLNYVQRQLSLSLEALNRGDVFAKTRVANNLKQLGTTLSRNYALNAGTYSSNSSLNQSFNDNTIQVEQALRKAEGEQQQEINESAPNNREALSRHVDQQKLQRGKNVNDVDDRNFDTREAAQQQAQAGEGKFNAEWFKKNTVKGGQSESEAKPDPKSSRIASKPAAQSQSLDDNKAQGARIRLNQGDGLQQDKTKEMPSLSNEAGARGRAIGNYRDKLSKDTTRQTADEIQTANASPNAPGMPPTAGRPAGGPQPGFGPGAGVPGGPGGGGMGGLGGPSPNQSVPNAVLLDQSGAMGLSSLTVEIPQRGVEYRFATARGKDIAIEARYAHGAWVDRWRQTGITLAFLVAALLAIWFLVWLLANRRWTWWGSGLLMLAGLLLIVVWGYGLPGLAAVAISVGNGLRHLMTVEPAQAQREPARA